MTALPPSPPESPAVQTMRWLVRPIAFLESCRRRFGDAFSVRFLGFQTPMVMISDPEAIQALYSEREHVLPPGRTIALGPVLGERSVLLLEGREHLARRRLMLPPFHGERMRAYEQTVAEVVARDVETWPRGEPFALHPHMQAITLEVILRAVFGVTDPERRAILTQRLGGLLGGDGVGAAAVPRPAVATVRHGADPLEDFQQLTAGDRRRALRRDRRPARRTRARTSSRC